MDKGGAGERGASLSRIGLGGAAGTGVTSGDGVCALP